MECDSLLGVWWAIADHVLRLEIKSLQIAARFASGNVFLKSLLELSSPSCSRLNWSMCCDDFSGGNAIPNRVRNKRLTVREFFVRVL